MVEKNEYFKKRIEKNECISEVQSKSFEVIRLNKVKYFGNPSSFMDIRFYQRGTDDKGGIVYYPTKKGLQIKENLFVKIMSKFNPQEK